VACCNVTLSSIMSGVVAALTEAAPAMTGRQSGWLEGRPAALPGTGRRGGRPPVAGAAA
jgi:hypothetical protein